MTDYDDLADRAERGQLAPAPGTALRGAAAADAARDALLAATGADSLENAVTIARGRPRLDAEEAAGPMWKVRATKPLDQKISQLAKRRGVSKSQILREAAAAYVEAS
ncbi:ribbon-helix-helix protein, CopG family (plasmid) [Rathayibacter sp. VKM Ac-2803]|uniref:ribbon-helix-helix domain-containing protein n=1 Tax=Rathayibacter sp. VKM Ac-2803 TaxID=2609256 RepID=UPI0013595BEC|nr:ribbon-helix-helix domain-containing protein [Rathayibacter sp. VKM Ac-2803]MWV51616.1 ribbon-helix-helix protein, CopG family [Rathayibacter sp. VKM Ac-2803]